MRELVSGVAKDRKTVPALGGIAVGGLFVFGTLFVLAFFTVHFGGFHVVHSVFLNQFFPVTPNGTRGFPNWTTYLEVFHRYWWFLPAAFLAEREGFRTPPAPAIPDTAVTPEAIKRRKAKGDAMMQPYKNVIRMHLLIFFFAFAHFTHLANFAIYAVAYAVYFFPWRLLKKDEAVVSR